MKAKPPSGSSKKAKPPVSQESFGLPGKTYKTPANAVKTTSLPKENKTKLLAGMQGSSNFKNRSLGEVVNAALAVTSVAGLAKTVATKQLAQSVGKAAVAKSKEIIGKATVPRQAGRDAYEQLAKERGGSQFVPKQVRKQEWLKFSPEARNSASKIPTSKQMSGPPAGYTNNNLVRGLAGKSKPIDSKIAGKAYVDMIEKYGRLNKLPKK